MKTIRNTGIVLLTLIVLSCLLAVPVSADNPWTEDPPRWGRIAPGEPSNPQGQVVPQLSVQQDGKIPLSYPEFLYDISYFLPALFMGNEGNAAAVEDSDFDIVCRKGMESVKK